MLSKQMLNELNNQIRTEWQAAYYYLGISGYCELNNFKGGAHFFRLQQAEEIDHAMKIFDYVVGRRQGEVTLQALEEPAIVFASLREAFEGALRSEQATTQNIARILEMAHDKKDYATVNLLNWFADEQAEEEAMMDYFVDRLTLVGNDGTGLLMVDNELLGREADAARK